MAKFESTIFNSIRGSVAGTTFFTNPEGQIIGRMKTKPVNPQTGPQSLIRSQFSGSVGVWEAMTQANRDLWNSYAIGLGSGKTGRQVFIGNYTLAEHSNGINAASVTLDDAPPEDPGVLPVGSIVSAPITSPGTGVALEVGNPNTYDFSAVCAISPQFSPARQRYQGPFLSASDQAVLCSGPSTQLIEFLNLVLGGVYFIRIKCVRSDDYHTISPSYIVRGIATTVV